MEWEKSSIFIRICTVVAVRTEVIENPRRWICCGVYTFNQADRLDLASCSSSRGERCIARFELLVTLMNANVRVKLGCNNGGKGISQEEDKTVC